MIFVKDPEAILDYTIDWTDWLVGTDTITASIWSASVGIVVGTTSFTDNTTVVWLSGGTLGQTYFVTNHVTTVGGRQDDRTLEIQCEER